MKKILSLTLVLAMVMSMGITTAFAAGNWEGGTLVTYSSTGAEEWTVTVPATLAPGGAGFVSASGTWGSDRKLVVSADENVVLTNSINSNDQKDLVVTFPGIELVGSNTAAVSDNQLVEVADISDALFGTWSGTFYYDVEMVDNVELFTISLMDNGVLVDDNGPKEIQVEVGMTWGEWANSKYNTLGFKINDYAQLARGENEFGMGKDVIMKSALYTPVSPNEVIRTDIQYEICN